MDASIPEELQRTWLDWLHRSWEAINHRELGGQLRRPIIDLEHNRGRLGSWNPTSRVLRLSVDHLRTALWCEVELTLRHEMAHQVVSELFGAPGAPVHGSLFRRACRLLRLQDSPRLEVRRTGAEVRALEKIRKLLSLATSSNPHEAQVAMATANRLLLQHNLEAADAELHGREEHRLTYRWIGRPTGRITLERKLLAGILQEFFFVRAIWIRTRRAADQKRVSVLEILGSDHNLDIAEYVHDYLVRTLDLLWLDYRRLRRRQKGLAARNDYRTGVLMGFRDHLESQRERDEEDGLIWLGDPALDEVFAERYPNTRRLGASYYRPGHAHRAGRRAGRKVRLRPGLRERQKDRKRRLIDSD